VRVLVKEFPCSERAVGKLKGSVRPESHRSTFDRRGSVGSNYEVGVSEGLVKNLTAPVAVIS
jgi:hypothetical protein